MISTILLGTTNGKKILEMRPLLESLGCSLIDLSTMPDYVEVEESGDDFIKNARIKAITYATKYRVWTIGEDSGLCVTALNGAPGVYSARYASLENQRVSLLPNASNRLTQDQANNDLLLERLTGIPVSNREAHYVSTIVLASPTGQPVIEAEGECWGRIVETPRGLGGFGYDPLFEVIEYHRTFAELGPRVKRVLSHRARALKKFLRRLSELQNRLA